MSRYKIHNQNATYFLTLTVVGWIDVFTRKACKDIVIDSLRYCQENKGLNIYAYVIMSNHLHLIVNVSEPNQLSNVLRDFKQFTAKKIKDYLLTIKKESRRKWMLKLLKWFAKNAIGEKERDFMLWQAGNHPIEVYSPKVIEQKLQYIHLNPVRAGIVHKAEHYVYSSASNYFLGKGILDITVIEPSAQIGYIHFGR